MKFDQKKQSILLYTSTLSSTFLGVVSSIINTHFFDPSDYGDVRYVQNILNFIASILLFGFFVSGSRLLALSKDEIYARQVRGALVLILAFASLIMATGSVICFFIFRNSNSEVSFLFLISILVCYFPLLLNYINTTAQGDNHIIRLSLARFLPAFIYVPMAYFVYKYTGATPVKMMLLQWGIPTIFLIIIIISSNPAFNNLRHVFSELKKENRQYGIHLYVGSLIMVSTNYIAGIMLGHINEDNSQVGFYTLALTIASPLGMLPGIIGTTYFKKFATLPSIPKPVLKNTLLLTFVSYILFISFIKPVVVFLYTEKYAIVGSYASLIAIATCLHGVGDMINRYLGSHGKGKCIRNASIFNGLFKIFGFIVLVKLLNVNGAILTALICNFIYFTTLVYYYVRFVNGKLE